MLHVSSYHSDSWQHSHSFINSLFQIPDRVLGAVQVPGLESRIEYNPYPQGAHCLQGKIEMCIYLHLYVYISVSVCIYIICIYVLGRAALTLCLGSVA